MKVILLKDVKGIGRTHETIEAKDGHALNYLIPQRFAIPATPMALKDAEMRKKQTDDRKELDVKLTQQNIAALAEQRIVIRAKANEKEHLYDAVGAPEIAKATNLPEEVIKLEKPIKELGTFEIPVAIGETFGKFSITIEAET